MRAPGSRRRAPAGPIERSTCLCRGSVVQRRYRDLPIPADAHFAGGRHLRWRGGCRRPERQLTRHRAQNRRLRTIADRRSGQRHLPAGPLDDAAHVRLSSTRDPAGHPHTPVKRPVDLLAVIASLACASGNAVAGQSMMTCQSAYQRPSIAGTLGKGVGVTIERGSGTGNSLS
jgi:hypothetical protein